MRSFPQSTAVLTELGQEGAFDWKVFYEANFEHVYRWLGRFGAPAEDLEDLTHEVFAIAHRKLPGFRAEASLQTWLFSIARKVSSRSRRRAHFRRLTSACLAVLRGDATPPPNGALHDLERLLAGLPEAQRMTLLLHEVDGMTAAEIARLYGCSEATVASRLRIAWKKVRTKVEGVS